MNNKGKPIIIYSYRKVKPGGMEVYHKKAKTWADYCKKNVPGFKTNTYCEFPETELGEVNEDRKHWVADIQFFNSIEVFIKHMFLTNPRGLIKTFQFLGATEKETYFTGYGFGDWDKSVFLGINLPKMFSMMPPPKWFEMRRDTAGFIRSTSAPKSNPPLFLFCDFHLKNAEDAKMGFIKKWKSVADNNANNPNVIAFQLTEDELNVKLLDKAKQRDPKKLVGVMVFIDFDTLKHCVENSLIGINDYLASPAKIDIWAEEDNIKTSKVCANTFGGKDNHTCFRMEHGWSNHKSN